MANYDSSSVSSIVEYSRKLIGQSLSEVVELPNQVAESKGKGKLGQLVEELFFEIKPPNNHDPDFPEAGLELKTTGVVLNSKNAYAAKERLVLTNINFNTIHLEDWESSTLLAKCKLMLLLFYLYDSELPEVKRKFVLEPTLLDLLKLTESDLVQIIQDWNFIREKVASKQAHEISEGDTTYLKACRKGKGGEDERLASQANSAIRAQTRAFALPASFITRLIRERFPDEVSILSSSKQTVTEATKEKLDRFLGKSVEEICNELSWHSTAKNLNYQLVRRMLTGTGSKPEELEKAQIKLRTITVRANGTPTENFPFASFEFLSVANQEWEDSDFATDLETRYLLVVFAEDGFGSRWFKKAGFWTMPYQDRLEAREVWEITKARINSNNYELPKSTEHHIAFVNTHGKNSSDLVETPQGGFETRRSFWLNKHYLAGIIRDQLHWNIP